MIVRGTLNINGTVNNPVVLKWHSLNSDIEGINIKNNGTLNADYCVFQYAPTALHLSEPLASCVIDHATFTGNQTAITWQSNHVDPITISNSAFHSCTIDGPDGSNDPNILINYSMFDTPPINLELNGTNDVIEAGLNLIDPANGNYQPNIGSPLIDNGNPSCPNDPDGTVSDIGAFYYVIDFDDFNLSISGDVGDHPTISWNPVYFDDENQDLAESYEIYSFHEFDSTPVYYMTTEENSIEDTRYIIAYIEQTITGRRFALKKSEPDPEQTNRIKRYWNIKALDSDGHKTGHSPSVYAWVEIAGAVEKLATPIIPKDYELKSAFPNPFNPTVTIPFGLPTESDVSISIYNITGQLVRSMMSSTIQPGYHSVQWNSLTTTGQKVPSGMYIVRMDATSTNEKKSFTQSQKIILLK